MDIEHALEKVQIVNTAKISLKNSTAEVTLRPDMDMNVHLLEKALIYFLKEAVANPQFLVINVNIEVFGKVTKNDGSWILKSDEYKTDFILTGKEHDFLSKQFVQKLKFAYNQGTPVTVSGVLHTDKGKPPTIIVQKIK